MVADLNVHWQPENPHIHMMQHHAARMAETAQEMAQSRSHQVADSSLEGVLKTHGELMNRVRYRGESFVVERGGKATCEILLAMPPKFSRG